MIPRETLDQIAAANDIVDVIGSYFPLKRAGSEFKALCPFHQEKSPSFTVSPQRQLFYCFGCGAGGSVFDFVARYENIDFPTAATRLAERAGIRIAEEERSPDEAREFNLRKRLLDLHQQAAEWYHKLLMKAPAAESARAYLKKRGLTSEVSKRWKIGYAPAKRDALIRWAEGQGFKTDEIVQSGLVSRRDAEDPQSDFYDRFRDRVMFPICNDLGEVIAFSGRLLAPEVKAVKYVNSPETPLFKKGDILFGLHKSKRALIDQKSAIVLEGQIDLITAFEAGVKNVVASQGTAFTDKQARTLKRYAEKEVVLCFDADQAGRKAAERSLPALLGLSLGIRVIELPVGEDPDSLIRSQGAEAFKKRVEAARDYFDYRIDTAAADPDFATPQVRTEFAKSMAITARLIGDALLRESVAAKVATRLGMVLPNFWKLLSGSESRPANATAPESKPGFLNPTAIKAPINGLTLLALGDLDIRRWISSQPWIPCLLELEGAELLVKILDSEMSLAEPASVAAFAAHLDEQSQALLNALLRERLPENRLDAARDCWRQVEYSDIEHRRTQLLAKIRDPNLSPGEQTEIQKQLFDLQSRDWRNQIDLLNARLSDPNLSPGKVTEIQKQILDLQKLLTDISRPLSPPGLE